MGVGCGGLVSEGVGGGSGWGGLGDRQGGWVGRAGMGGGGCGPDGRVGDTNVYTVRKRVCMNLGRVYV